MPRDSAMQGSFDVTTVLVATTTGRPSLRQEQTLNPNGHHQSGEHPRWALGLFLPKVSSKCHGELS